MTLVDGDEFEYIDWKPPSGELQSIPSEIRDNKAGKEDDGDSFFFPEEQLSQMGKGTRRLWRPWQRNIKRYDVRPYRCFHVGDLVEVPVMYPDFRYRYHAVDHSQLYLPARIIEVEGDQYMVEFSPDCLAYNWWPGRIAKGEGIELEPGSGVKVRNPFDVNRLTLSMDLVRPFSVGSRPVLGIQSLKPADWNAFQGVQLQNLEDLLEQSLWGDECDST